MQYFVATGVFVLFWSENSYLLSVPHKSTAGENEPSPHSPEHHCPSVCSLMPWPQASAHALYSGTLGSTQLYAPLANLVPINIYFGILSKPFLVFGLITHWLHGLLGSRFL